MRLYTTWAIVALVFTGTLPLQANATFIQTDFSAGPMLEGVSTEAFGVLVGDTISGDFVYDDSSLVAGTNFVTLSALSIVFPDRSWGFADIGVRNLTIHLAADFSLLDWTLNLVDGITDDRVVVASNNTAALTEAGGRADLFCNNCVNFSQRQVSSEAASVPEPAALSFALSGLAMLALVRMRRGGWPLPASEGRATARA